MDKIKYVKFHCTVCKSETNGHTLNGCPHCGNKQFQAEYEEKEIKLIIETPKIINNHHLLRLREMIEKKYEKA